MELTRIVLNLADRHARGDLADPYQMHSTLARAFPTAPDAAPARFLWRSEPGGTGPPIVLVQGRIPGQWAELLRARPGWALRLESRTWDPERILRDGMVVDFRLRANPTVTREGKRRALLAENDQVGWLQRQFDGVGIELLGAVVREAGKVTGRRRKDGAVPVVVHGVLYEGRARLRDAASAAAAVCAGLGHAKMLGLGLLSLAPSKD